MKAKNTESLVTRDSIKSRQKL